MGTATVPMSMEEYLGASFRPDVDFVGGADVEVEQIVRTAPLVCVEVWSPEDRLLKTLELAKDFHGMGVGCVWISDPATRKAWASTVKETTEWRGGLLRVPGTAIVLDPQEVFARMARPGGQLRDA